MDCAWRLNRLGIAALVITLAGALGCGTGTSSTNPNQPPSNSGLALADPSLDFGTVVVGSGMTQTDTITNNSSKPVTISAANASATDFQLSSPALPLTLPAGQSADVTIACTPKASGSPAGNITLVTNMSGLSQLQIAVAAKAVNAGSMSASPASVPFGNVSVGKSQNQTVTITNPGGSSVTISAASASSAAYTLSGLTLPKTLGAGQSVTLTIAFLPKSSGTANGNISITGSASLTTSLGQGKSTGQASKSTSLTVAVSGSGVAAGQLNVSPGALSFGNVTVGKTSTQTATLSNSGNSSITVNQVTASGSGFSLSGLSLPATLAAGQSLPFSVVFAPKAGGSVSGSVAITSSASNASVTLSGTGVTPGALVANPTSISFGNVQAGSSKNVSETVTNTGGSAVKISSAIATGSDFSISGLTIPATLNAGQSATFTVTFAPQSSGSSSGNIAIASDAPNPTLNIGLSGGSAAPGQLSAAPSTLSFGSITVGANKSLTGTLTASGSSVTVTSATSNSSEFKLSGLSLPLTLSAGQSATYTITFTPQSSGAASGTATFTSNAANSPATQAMTGTGAAAPQHSVTLSWSASTSTVTGYHVYRGTSSGGPYTVIDSNASDTSFTDNSVAAGQTYFYVVTAVDSQGNESVYSNQAKATIPTP
jgi:hypothetical protein